MKILWNLLIFSFKIFHNFKIKLHFWKGLQINNCLYLKLQNDDDDEAWFAIIILKIIIQDIFFRFNAMMFFVKQHRKKTYSNTTSSKDYMTTSELNISVLHKIIKNNKLMMLFYLHYFNKRIVACESRIM